MKKTISLLLVLILAFTRLPAAAHRQAGRVWWELRCHARFLLYKEILKEKGYELELRVYRLYQQSSLQTGSGRELSSIPYQ